MQGSAGQSFACFLVNGMKVKLIGEANDYVGKGMAGGDVTIVPPPNSLFKAEDASLVGNTCLYGATGGRLFVNGRAGEIQIPILIALALEVVPGKGRIPDTLLPCYYTLLHTSTKDLVQCHCRSWH